MLKHKRTPKTGQTQQITATPGSSQRQTPGQKRRRPLDNYLDPEYIWEEALSEESPDEAIPEIPDNTEEEDDPVFPSDSAERPNRFEPTAPCLRCRYQPLWLWTGEFMIWATERPGVNPVETETLRSGLEKLINALHREGFAKDFNLLKGFIHRDWIDWPEPAKGESAPRKRTGNVAWLKRLDQRTIVDLETGEQTPIGYLFAAEGLRKGDIPDILRRHWLEQAIRNSRHPDSEDLKWSHLARWLPGETKEFFNRLNGNVRAAFPHTKEAPFTGPKESTLQRKWIPRLREERKDKKES